MVLSRSVTYRDYLSVTLYFSIPLTFMNLEIFPTFNSFYVSVSVLSVNPDPYFLASLSICFPLFLMMVVFLLLLVYFLLFLVFFKRWNLVELWHDGKHNCAIESSTKTSTEVISDY